MPRSKSYIGLLFFASFFHNGFCQKRKTQLVDPASFYADTTIIQNKSTFIFWRGRPDTLHTGESLDTMRNKLVIERITKVKDTLLFSDGIRDGEYLIRDRNGDGYADFTTFYHEYDEIHFFNPVKNDFDVKALGMPPSGLVDAARKIYYGSHDAMYGDRYAYSVLYRYIGATPYFYYQLKFITTEEYGDKDSATHVNLYRCRNGNFSDTVFVKQIKTATPGNFNDRKYWVLHYKKLLGYH